MVNVRRLCDHGNTMARNSRETSKVAARPRPAKDAGTTADDKTDRGDAERNPRADLIAAALGLLGDHGPDALQTRKIAAAAGTSTMAVYTYFGGMRELIAEVAEEGLRQFRSVQAAVHQTDDPIADFMVTGMAYRQFAIDNPHLYRLMFGGTSAHGINAPSRNMFDESDAAPGHPSAAFLFRCVQRAMAAGRIGGSPDDPARVATTAAKFWTVIHGFVMLELAGFWGGDGVAVGPVLGSLSSDLLFAFGDKPERIAASTAAAATRIAALSQAS